MKNQIKIFRVIWSNKRGDVKQWFFYNVVIGLLPIWLSWLPLIVCWRLGKMLDPLLNGTILVFGASLTAASVAFFTEEAKRGLKQTNRFIWNGMLLTLLLSASAYATVITLNEVAPGVANQNIIIGFSCLILITAIALNLQLAAVRIAYSDNNLISELLKFEPEMLSKDAASATNVDGVKL
ncbi:MAG: hypothetical protein RLZZ505_90 [Verrucomicrobiota bacterium]|jgi:hypothetical protein